MPGPPRGRPTRGVKASVRTRATVVFSFLLGGLFMLGGILRLYLSLR
jgi:hypothetical protein